MNKRFFLFLLAAFCLLSCKTIKQPDSVAEELDYTKDDVISNEINQIQKLMAVNPVKALWRAQFLGDEVVLKQCKDTLENALISAIEAKDTEVAGKYITSLKNSGYSLSKDVLDRYNSLVDPKIPGFTVDKTKLPKNISNCIDATVTVWLDKGLKVQNGSGMRDIVIGSGFFIDNRGYIITNHHVIADLVDPKYEGFARLYIKLPGDSDSKYPATVVGYDSIIDLALLKTELVPPYVFSLGSSADLHVGDKVSAIGTPIGLDGTLTSGVISNVNRQITTLGKVFQIDAAVNSGNSGGPLIDENRQVQAIVFAGMLQFQGLNFAIPVEYLKQELPLLYQGEVIHSWIGAYGHTYKEKNQKAGLEIQYVMPGGVAHFAGLREGCIIKEINGSKINSLEDFQYALMGVQAETITECKYIYQGQQKSVLIYLDRRPENPAVSFYNSDYITDSFIPLFGMKLKPASTSNRKSYRIENVITGSIADEYGLSENDPVVIYDVKTDYENKGIVVQMKIQQKTKGYLDMTVVLGTAFDSPYYF